MKLAHFVRTFPTLSETFVLRQIRGLLSAGHDVDVYTLGAGPMDGLDLFDLPGRLRVFPPEIDSPLVYAKRAVKSLPGLLLSPRLCVQALSQKGIAVDTLLRLEPLLYGAAPRYDIAHAHFGQVGIGLELARRLGRIKAPVVVSFLGGDITRFVTQNGPAVYDNVIRNADLLLPLNSFFAKKLLAWGADPARVHVYRMGLDVNGIAFKPRHVEVGEPVRIVTVGRLVEKKGTEYLLRAIAAAKKKTDRALRVEVIGTGPLEDRLKKLAATLGLQEHVVFHGAQPNTRVLALLEQAHLFSLPSVTAADGDMEGTPFSIMEAMAAGLPVLVTRHSGIPELVDDGVSGRVVPERDVEGLAQALLDLLAAPDKWELMGRMGRGKIEEEYNGPRLDPQLLQLYARVAERPRA